MRRKLGFFQSQNSQHSRQKQNSRHRDYIPRMHTFIDHVHHLRLEEQLFALGENVYDLNHKAYDQLFATELKRLAMQTNDRMAKAQLEDLAEKFKFTAYTVRSICWFQRRPAGESRPMTSFRSLFLDALFQFDPATIPFGKRMRSGMLSPNRSNRQRLIPSIPISDEEGVGIPSSQIAGKNVGTDDQGVTDELQTSFANGLARWVCSFELDGDRACWECRYSEVPSTWNQSSFGC